MHVGSDYDGSALRLFSEGNVTLPLPLNDADNELQEGYLFILELDTDNVHPLDVDRIQFLNRFVLVTIEDDDSKNA